MKEIPKTCSTCAHKKGDKCMLSGYYAETERKYPTLCGVDFSGWTQKLGIIDKFLLWFKQSK